MWPFPVFNTGVKIEKENRKKKFQEEVDGKGGKK